MADSAQYGRDAFEPGGRNEQLDADSLAEEIGLERSERRWHRDGVGFTNDDNRRLRAYRDDFANKWWTMATIP